MTINNLKPKEEQKEEPLVSKPKIELDKMNMIAIWLLNIHIFFFCARVKLKSNKEHTHIIYIYIYKIC